MATLGPFGVPTGSAGILHPKLSNKFRVTFAVGARDGEDPASVKALMDFLSMQCVAVELPEQLFTTAGVGVKRGPVRKHMKNISVKGDLLVRLQDDVTNGIAAAIDLLADHQDDVEVAVMKLDGDEGILEAYAFGKLQLFSMKHSTLDYAAGHTTINGQITDNRDLDERSSPHRLEVGLHLSAPGEGAVQEKTLTFKVGYAQHGHFTPSQSGEL